MGVTTFTIKNSQRKRLANPLSLRINPHLITVQNTFFGRLYSADLFLLYRALSGKYYQTPSLLATSLGLGANQDLLQYFGAAGPAARSLWYGNQLEIFYNNLMRDNLSKIPEFNLPQFWAGWNHFSKLLRDDAEKAGTPRPQLSPLSYKLESVRLSETDLAKLDDHSKFIYYTYRGDLEWTEQSFTLASAYTPELILFHSIIFPDFQWIFTKYTEWINERINRATATKEARIISKSILLSNYRWFLLVGDLLIGVDPMFETTTFREGLKKIADWIRTEAENIRFMVLK